MAPPDGSSSYTPILVEKFNKAVQLVEDLIRKVREQLTKFIDAVNAFIKRVADAIRHSHNPFKLLAEAFTGDIAEGLDKVRSLATAARDKINEILTKAEESVDGAVPVGSLFSRAFDLGDKVNRPLTGMSGDMTGSGDIDFWRGPAKDTYEKRVKDQQDAVANASSQVMSLTSYLGDAATGNVTYMASLGERMGEVYGSLTTAAIDLAGTAAGNLPQGIALLTHFSEVIGTAVTQIVGYIAQLGSRIAEVLNQILSLESQKSNLTGLTKEGMWPSPVAD